MKEITKERKKELEKIVGHAICSLVVEKIEKLGYGIFERPEPTRLFYCGANNKIAEGGLPDAQLPGAAKTPCSAEFAEQCLLYRMITSFYY